MNHTDPPTILLKDAQSIAQSFISQISPYCQPHRCVAAGSVRRMVPGVRDIEIVLVRKSSELFNFTGAINRLRKLKGEAIGKYTQRLFEGVKLDIFMCDEQNFGNILAIRTGSAKFSKWLAREWVVKGYYSEGGYLYRDDLTEVGRTFAKGIGFKEEVDLFNFLDVEFLAPEDRCL